MDTWLGTRSLVFWANRSFFAKEWANERFAQKNELWLIHSFLVSDLSDHHSLKKREWANRSFFKNKKHTKYTILVKFYHERPDWIPYGRSFFMIDLSDLLTVALLIWATWAIPSQLLICLERSEWIAHRRSFDMSNLSKWAMSEWENSQGPWVDSYEILNISWVYMYICSREIIYIICRV